jgi:hypothetical protein
MSCVLFAEVLLVNTAVVNGRRMNISDRRLLQAKSNLNPIDGIAIRLEPVQSSVWRLETGWT